MAEPCSCNEPGGRGVGGWGRRGDGGKRWVGEGDEAGLMRGKGCEGRGDEKTRFPKSHMNTAIIADYQSKCSIFGR